MDRNIRLVGLATLAAAILTPALAIAQTPPTSKMPVAPKNEQRDPKACADNQEILGQGGSPDTGKPSNKSLSDRLALSDGVICPPSHVDPEINHPAPPGGPMPVIPPPGSPGGDPSVRPK